MNDKIVNVLDNNTNLLKKRNVCAYARVSSEKDTQIESFDAQVSYYTNLILDNTEWNFIGVYADEGKSGTSIQRRDQFQMMIDLAKTKHIDLILTKSISRFARNVIDTLSILQELRKHGTEVFFEKENISSFDPKIEFVITVLAGMAEEESRTISENVKWSVRKKFKNGEVIINTNNVMGYEKDKSGSIFINEEQAKIVRKIYELYLSGMGAPSIAKHLTNHKIKTVRNNDVWRVSSVIGILRNEKYTGNAYLQKTLRPDFKVKKSIKNDYIIPKYYVENSHPKIIDQETYDKVQHRLDSKMVNRLTDMKSFPETQYASLCHCGLCGHTFHHKINNSNTQFARRMLICSSNKNSKTCQSETFFSDTFDIILAKQINLLLENKNEVLLLAQNALETDIQYINLIKETKATEAKLSALQQKYSDMTSSNDAISHMALKKLNTEINQLKIDYASLRNKILTQYNFESKIINLKKVLKELEEYNGHYKNLDIKTVFSKVVIIKRDYIYFYINLRSIDSIELSNKGILFLDTIVHTIRKTDYHTTFGVIF